MYDYLVTTVRRLERQYDGPREKTTAAYFKRGCAERLRERIEKRHHDQLQEQERKAKAERERWAAAGNSGNALVVVLRDYAQSEEDLNEDHRRGLPPGTTAQRRAEAERNTAARVAERDKRWAALKELGFPEEVAWYMALGFSQEAAERYAAPERQEKQEEKRQRAYERQYASELRKRVSPGWQAGRQAGESVGLDTQVGSTERRKLT